MKEFLSKKFDRNERIVKFYYTIILAISSALVWSIYAILEQKADTKILILDGIGIVFLVFYAIKTSYLEKEQDSILEKLKEIK